MIDLKLLQKDFENISKKLMRKGVDTEIIESLKSKNEELKKAKEYYKKVITILIKPNLFL